MGVLSNHTSTHHRSPLTPLLIILTGFALRLYKLGEQSLWYDETVSAFLADQPTLDLIAHTARDIHPPGYYLLLHFWATVAGHTEFALAYFSLFFGVLLMALTYRVARYLVDPATATWAALLVAISPFNIWYSQEVRMYSLGALLGLAATYCALRALRLGQNFKKLKQPATYRFWLGYFLFATIGLYTLYYFAFLLVVTNFVFLTYTLWSKIKRTALLALVMTNGLVLVAYLPWLPLAWRQATHPPVPPWRSLTNFWLVSLESWSALSLGQSVDPATVWPVLLLTLILFILGLRYLKQSLVSLATVHRPLTRLLLLVYTFGPLLLIYTLSFIAPLYHVRYVFTYASAFYIILGAGLAWLATRIRFWVALGVILLLLGASLYSVFQFHFSPRYQTDDFRAAVDFIQTRWQPGDVILTNAGYTYPAFVYYTNLAGLQRQRLVPYQLPTAPNRPILLQTGSLTDSPAAAAQLGWGDPRADFYAMTAVETMTALEEISNDYARLWLLRAYDTVTDPEGLIRTWLAENTIPLEDQRFAGESSIRAQGFLLPKQFSWPGETVYFEDGLALRGWHLPQQTWQPGQTIPLQLGWMATAPPSVDYKTSLKLWTETGELAAQGEKDEWPVGTLFRATVWPVSQTIYHPTQLTLSVDLPPGQYWLNVELYHPDTIQPLPRLDGGDPVVTLGAIIVK